MSKKAFWCWLGGVILATAAATWAVLEYAHRNPDSWLAHMFRHAGVLWEKQSTPTPSWLNNAPSSGAASLRRSIPTNPSPSLPPDILEQSLRELKLLDELATSGQRNQSADQTEVASLFDEFTPEKIPIRPRLVPPDPSYEGTLVSEGRQSAPVASLEHLPVTPQPHSEPGVPEDLDEEVAQLESAERFEDCDETPGSCHDAEKDTQDTSGGTGALRGQCNTPGCVANWSDCLRYWLGWICADTSSPGRKTQPKANNDQAEETGGGRRTAKPSCADGGHCAASRPRGAVPQQGCETCPCAGEAGAASLKAPVLVRRVYPIADLIESHDQGHQLQQLIIETLGPHTWQGTAPSVNFIRPALCPNCNQKATPQPAPEQGIGYIRYYPGVQCLVVVQTSEVQKEIVDFLGELRRAARYRELSGTGATKSLPCPSPEGEHIVVVPVIRPVLVPVAIPVPVGVGEQELPPPEFRAPHQAPHDDQNALPTFPDRPFAPPKTPEKLPNCQRQDFPALEMLERFQEWWRGAMPHRSRLPDCQPILPAHPQILPVFPPQGPEDEADDLQGAHWDHEDCDDLEDFQPLETELHPPIGEAD
ncbi:MAG: hypothetical protein NZM42_12015 [Gemmatales bacterium]|nr:hypothetical protein [Gemmatales bacterium]